MGSSLDAKDAEGGKGRRAGMKENILGEWKCEMRKSHCVSNTWNSGFYIEGK